MILNRAERMLARRYLLPGKGEGFIFVVAGFSVGAVALGVAALIIVMSVMNGFRAELFDNAGAVDLLTDVANRGRELRRIWIEDWAEAAKALALARLGRLEEVDWGRFDRPEWPASTRAVPSSPGACAASVSMPATCTMPASCWRSPTARWWRRST